MDVLRRNNVTVQAGDGPTYLFAHGLGCDQKMWRYVARAFVGRGTVVLFDHVGAGASQIEAYSSAKYADLQGYADDVVDICERLPLRDVVFVGHSVSATIGVLAAVKRPDLFSKLVLLCPSPRYANADGYQGGFEEADLDELLELMQKNQVDWSALMSPIVMGADSASDLQAEWRESVCKVDPAISLEFARATFKSDHRAAYHQVRTPTLLVECSADSLAPPAVGAFVHAAIAGSRRFVLDAAGHCPHMSDPAAVIAAISDFTQAGEAKAA